MVSRTEELRKKLTKQPPSEEYLAFITELETFLWSSRSASALGSDFAKRLFEEFKTSEQGDIGKWLLTRLDGLFTSELELPKWVDEPDWCFLDGEPMTFLHQFKDAEECVYYVFRGYRTTEHSGKRAVFKMTAQERLGRVRLSGEICC